MNRTNLIGCIVFIGWILSAIILLNVIFDLFAFILENFMECWEALFELNLLDFVSHGIRILIGAIIWIPYYMAGIGSILLMFESE